MRHYHVLVEQDENWFIGRVLERPGITTQGRSIDELIYMVRDAIELMWDERGVELELLLPGNARTSFERRKQRVRGNGASKRPAKKNRMAHA